MKILSWLEFDNAVQSLTSTFSSTPLSGVYGFPRGGLPLAVALSHSLEIPFLHSIEPGCLVVDDVYETGTTLSQARTTLNTHAAVWVSKAPPSWFTAAVTVPSSEWIVFPWESTSNATADQNAYHASRQ